MREVFLGFVMTCVIGGCASGAATLRPDQTARDEAAIFGRVVVHEDDKVITEECYVEITDEHDHRKAYVDLDNSGWVFTTIAPGRSYVSLVLCSGGAGNEFHTRYVGFEAPGRGELAYFGLLSVTLKRVSKASAVLTRSVAAGAGGLAGAFVGGVAESRLQRQTTLANSLQHASLERDLPAALAEYKSRYPAGAQSLKVVDELVFGCTGESCGSPVARTDALIEHQGLVQARVKLADWQLGWVGLPARDKRKVTIRIEHDVSKPQFNGCKELTIQLDDAEPQHYVLARKPMQWTGLTAREAVQSAIDFAVLAPMSVAAHARIEICGVSQTFDVQAQSVLRDFVGQFEAVATSEPTTADPATP
jgi:hypothetical protein